MKRLKIGIKKAFHFYKNSFVKQKKVLIFALAIRK
jgi:hypothetical protein